MSATGQIAFESLSGFREGEGSCSKEAIKGFDLHTFQDRFFKPSQKAPPIIISSGTGSAIDVIADISSTTRGIADLTSPIDAKLTMGPTYHVMGTTTAVNTLQSIFSLQKCSMALAQAKKMGDEKGIAACQQEIVGRVGQLFGGVGYLFYRIDQVANSAFYANSAHLATSGLVGSMLGNLGFSLFFAVFSVISGYSLKQNAKLLKELDVATPKEQIEVLFRRMQALDEVPKEIDFNKEAGALIGSLFQAHVKEMINAARSGAVDITEWKKLIEDVDKISDEQWTQIGEDVLTFLETNKSKELLEKMGLASIDAAKPLAEQIGMLAWKGKKNAIKEMDLVRVIGEKNVAALKKAQNEGLLERLNHSDSNVRAVAKKEAEDLIFQIKETIHTSDLLNGSLFGACFISTFIMGLFGVLAALGLFAITVGIFANPYVLIALAGLALLTYVAMLIGDGGFWLNGLKGDGPVSKTERRYLQASLALSVIATSVGLFLSDSLFKIITVLIIGLGWWGVGLYSLYLLDKKEERFKKANPTLVDFENHLQDLRNLQQKIEESKSVSAEDVMRLNAKGKVVFDKLATVHKEGLYEELLKALLESDTAHKKIAETLEKRLGKEGEKISEKEDSPLSSAASKGKTFYETRPDSPVIKKVKHAFLRKGYSEKLILSKEVEEKFYSAIYHQVALEIRETIYEEIELADLEKALKAVRQSIARKALSLQESLSDKKA